jgi:hypothetical protein
MLGPIRIERLIRATMRWVGQMVPVLDVGERTSMHSMIRGLQNLSPISFDVDDPDLESFPELEPSKQLIVHVHASVGVILETSLMFLDPGRDFPEYAIENSGSSDRHFSNTLGPGFYTIVVTRVGITNTGITTLTKSFSNVNVPIVPTEPVPVPVVKAPVLYFIVPSTTTPGKPGFTLTLKGSDFLSAAKVQWNSLNRPTTFVSATELHATIAAADVATVKTIPVRVLNPDGQVSTTISFTIAPIPPKVVGFDEMLIQNCNANTLPGSDIHRPIHIYFRRTDLGTPDPWSPINGFAARRRL